MDLITRIFPISIELFPNEYLPHIKYFLSYPHSPYKINSDGVIIDVFKKGYLDMAI